ncbi:MAG: hypothetical protein QW176_02550 [Candidatus Bathyarchaeia archaeon]
MLSRILDALRYEREDRFPSRGASGDEADEAAAAGGQPLLYGTQEPARPGR